MDDVLNFDANLSTGPTDISALVAAKPESESESEDDSSTVECESKREPKSLQESIQNVNDIKDAALSCGNVRMLNLAAELQTCLKEEYVQIQNRVQSKTIFRTFKELYLYIYE